MAKVMQEVASEMLESIRKTNGLMEGGDVLHRERRDDTHPADLPASPQIPVQRLSSIRPLFPICSHAIYVTTMVFNGVTVMACITGGPKASVTIGALSLSARKFASHSIVPDLTQPTKAAMFEYEGSLLLMVIDLTRHDGVRMYKIDKNFQTKPETVTSAGFPTSVVVWKPNSGDSYHMAIASSPDPRIRQSSYKNETHFYRFKETYFDHYVSVDSFLVRDVCPFTDGGRDYIVIVNSEATPKAHGTQVDSELFRFDDNDVVDSWKSIQKIKTTGAVDCEIFSMGSVAGRQSRPEVFLAIANQQDRTPTGVTYNVDSVVYKFANERFIPFQCLHTVKATSIKAINPDADSGRFLLAVAHAPGVVMYQYNGWKFTPASVQFPP